MADDNVDNASTLDKNTDALLIRTIWFFALRLPCNILNELQLILSIHNKTLIGDLFGYGFFPKN